MDDRLNSAYASLKFSQQVLVTLLGSELPHGAKDRISDVLAELAHAQDALIVLREGLQRLEFDHAALQASVREQQRPFEGMAPPPARREGASQQRSS